MLIPRSKEWEVNNQFQLSLKHLEEIHSLLIPQCTIYRRTALSYTELIQVPSECWMSYLQHNEMWIMSILILLMQYNSRCRNWRHIFIQLHRYIKRYWRISLETYIKHTFCVYIPLTKKITVKKGLPSARKSHFPHLSPSDKLGCKSLLPKPAFQFHPKKGSEYINKKTKRIKIDLTSTAIFYIGLFYLCAKLESRDTQSYRIRQSACHHNGLHMDSLCIFIMLVRMLIDNLMKGAHWILWEWSAY